jgi:hypothetical protein
LGLTWIIVMHEPIYESDGSPYRLAASRYGDGKMLGANTATPDEDTRLLDRGGYAFAA